MKISVRLILLGLSAKEESRKTARRGWRAAILRTTVSGIFCAKQAISAGVSPSFIVWISTPSIDSVFSGIESSTPQSTRQAKSKSRSVRSSFMLLSSVLSRSYEVSLGE